MSIVDLMKQAKAEAFPADPKALKGKGDATLRAFAERIGKDNSYVNRLERGERSNPSAEVIDAWFAACGRRLVVVPERGPSVEDVRALPEHLRDALCAVARELPGLLERRGVGSAPALMGDDVDSIADAVISRVLRRLDQSPDNSATSQDSRAKRV